MISSDAILISYMMLILLLSFVSFNNVVCVPTSNLYQVLSIVTPHTLLLFSSHKPAPAVVYFMYCIGI